MNWLRAFGRFFEQKIGLHRLGIVLSVIIIAVAAVVLYRKLHNINVSKVLTAMATVEYRDVAISALFVAAGYFTLTFYDLFALRTIGRKDVPYRVAALAGFTSYSVGHNVGASVFTGGAVRYRIYSAWGLDAIEVAKICFIAGLTFWLGNITVLGFGFAYHPRGGLRTSTSFRCGSIARWASSRWRCWSATSPGCGGRRASSGGRTGRCSCRTVR